MHTTTDTSPLVVRRLPSLREQVHAGLREIVLKLPPGRQLESERTLAGRFGVSRPTIRAALRRLRSEGFIESRHGKGNFVSTRGRTGRVLYYRADLSPEGEGVYAQCYGAMLKTVQEAGHRLSLAQNPDAPHLTGPPLEEVLPDEKEAVVITLGVMDDEYIRRAVELAAGVITVDYEAPGADADAVVFDSFGAGRVLGEHLMQLGHRQIALVGGMRGSQTTRLMPEADSLQLQAGLEYAMQTRGLKTPPEWIHSLPLGAAEPARSLAGRLLAGRKRPSGVICFDATHAAAFIAAAGEAGLSVPGDLSVTCWGDAPGPDGPDAGITTIAASMREMGRQAGRVVVSRLNGSASPPVRICIPGELVDRGTTGRFGA